jgi:phosphate starvation-inducible protein PhoH
MRTKKPKTLQSINFELADVFPLTELQDVAFQSEEHLVLHGVAGTGKTYLSCYLGYRDMFKGLYERMVIIRNVVATRDIGFLPGSEADKCAVYEVPYKEATNELFARGDAYDTLKLKRVVEFKTTSFIRGITLKNAVIVVDEIQNMTFHELDSIITRAGPNCRFIFSGDFRQTDLDERKEKSGIHNFLRILEAMGDFDMIEYGIEDIVRSGLVKNYLIKKTEMGL